MKTDKAVDLLNGSISKGIIQFCIPLFMGQLLQQLYNIAEAWVVGNFADNNAFAAVSSGESLNFLVVGFFAGMTTAIRFIPQFTTICWCYPLTWSCSTIVFAIWRLTKDWTHIYDIL